VNPRQARADLKKFLLDLVVDEVTDIGNRLGLVGRRILIA
jgi:hypothetical protein